MCWTVVGTMLILINFTEFHMILMIAIAIGLAGLVGGLLKLTYWK